MFLKTYLTSIFVILFSIGVGTLLFTTYGFYMGSTLEKKGDVLQLEYRDNRIAAEQKLYSIYATNFEYIRLTRKYKFFLHPSHLCYRNPDKEDSLKYAGEQTAYNDSCKEKQIPEGEIRPEVEKIFTDFMEIDSKFLEDAGVLSNHIFMDRDAYTRKNADFFMISSTISFIALFFSISILFLVRRKNTISSAS